MNDQPSDLVAAAELVATGECSPACLVASGDDPAKCTCRCQGQYHGALADVSVIAPPTSWWKAADQIGWSDHLLSCLPVAHSIEAANRIYARARRAREPHALVEARGGKSWAVIWDGITMARANPKGTWPARESRLLNRVVDGLFARHRITSGGYAPCEYFSLGGIKALGEARVILAIVGECFVGNPAGAVRAIEVLEGRIDPVRNGLNPESSYPDQLARGWVEPRTFVAVSSALRKEEPPNA
jgi:hypothetical protein